MKRNLDFSSSWYTIIYKEKKSMIEELYTTKQVAKVLGFAPKTLSNQRILGTGLPFIKIGNAVGPCEMMSF